MTSKSDKITMRETFQIHWRAFKDVRRYCPGAFGVSILYGAAAALSPYVTVYLSARIINELAGARRPGVLWPLAVLAVASAAALTFVTGALLRWKTAKEAQFLERKNRVFADKMMSMDFADIDKTETHDLRSQIAQSENWAGFGFYRFWDQFEKVAQGLAGILGAAVLTVSLFTLPVPASAGAFTVLNRPAFLALLVLALAFTAALGPLCDNRAMDHLARCAENSRFGNRVFYCFGFLADDKGRGMDIRMYDQQKIARHYMETESVFNDRASSLPRACRGPIGVWAALGSCASAILTGLIYLFVCVKAWAGAFGVGSITQYVGAVSALAKNMGVLIEALGVLRSNVPFMRDIYQFLDIPNQMYQGSLTTEKRSDRQYEVEFQDVSFRYPGSSTWALRHVNIKFRIGRRMAVVGENGSGKTTFIKLLCRLYDPQEGHILLNGIDIRKYNYRDYMGLFSVVFQDFQLLAQPLGENVAGARNYDRDRAQKALVDAGFGDRLASMPAGLDTMLYKEFAEDGVDVSGGEAQKIAIARALYKDAPFIILDEPTAALDPIAEAEIYAKFNDIAGDKTAVYISHRLSSCKFCDEIAVFDHGQVIQRGTHEQLLADKAGKYHALWHAQAQYYTPQPSPAEA